jgi:hypothetical protein
MSQDNRCSCPTPPGGEVICEANQMPFCIITPDGQKHAICKTPLKTANALELINWVLSEVKQEYRSEDAVVGEGDIDILKARIFKAGGYTVAFSLTLQMVLALEKIERSHGFENDRLTDEVEV